MEVNYIKSFNILDLINIKILIQNLQELGFIKKEIEKLVHSQNLLIPNSMGFFDFLYC